MPDCGVIYAQHADKYEELVAREDYQGNIQRKLAGIRALDGLVVFELGAGTGRLTRQMAARADCVYACDGSHHMLDVAADMIKEAGLRNCHLAVADHRALPVRDGVADVVVSGWSICYTVVWHPRVWQRELGLTLAEMRRVLRPGGTMIILETLGTDQETPHPPEELVPYYRYLSEMGFQYTWIRTDYRFESRVEAEALTRFFFGQPMAGKELDDGRTILPECTGIWWLEV
jgi:ubiquinone/menaquinone biosynthesis C-methylase UbiE